MRQIKLKLSSYGRIFKFGLQQIFRMAPDIARPVLQEATLVNGKLFFTGHILSNYIPSEITFIVRKFRQETIVFYSPVATSPRAMRHLHQLFFSITGLKWYNFSVEVAVPWSELPSSIYGTGMKVDGKNRAFKVREAATKILSDAEGLRTFCVFIEPSALTLRIELYHFGPDVVDSLILKASAPRPNGLGCILGEYTNTARDNARALFEWLVKNAPDINAYYVIEAKNIDNYSTLQENVLSFGSVQHLERCLEAHVCAFTHHRSYVYPYILKLIDTISYDRTRTIFLQHGITAMKKSVVVHYRRSRVNYNSVAVCSRFEQKIFCDHFGYDCSQIQVTGFPRFDNLYAKSLHKYSNKKQVLFFPTWRPGLEKKTTEEVIEDSFFLNWNTLMKEAKNRGFKTILILHPMLFRHAGIFEKIVDEVREPTDFQDSLLESACLVTDYSSVSFDALYLGKPVYLFQFDQEAFGLRQDSFIDVDTQLPGEVSMTSNEVVRKLVHGLETGWRFNLKAQRDLYFDHCDDKNSERVLSLIKTLAFTS